MEQKTKAIGTITYKVTQLDAVASLKIQAKLIKILGAGGLSIIATALTKGMDKDIMKGAIISDVVPALLERFDDKEVVELVLSLFDRNVFYEKDGIDRKVEFSTHFSGKALEMWKVAGFILEANFNLGEYIKSNSSTTNAEKLIKESST